jgi:hypothetical protein
MNWDIMQVGIWRETKMSEEVSWQPVQYSISCCTTEHDSTRASAINQVLQALSKDLARVVVYLAVKLEMVIYELHLRNKMRVRLGWPTHSLYDWNAWTT